MNSKAPSPCDDTKAALLNLDIALEQLLAHAENLPDNAIEIVDLSHALNRVLAVDLTSSIDVPPSDNSAVDGYALSSDEVKVDTYLPISQRIPAGQSPEPLVNNTTARIFTGASIPSGADCVIMQEQADVDSASKAVKFTTSPSRFQNIRPKGQDIQTGQVILSKGQVITPQRLGLIASIGVNKIEVFSPIKVAILSTGDELVEPGDPINEGQIFNSNRYMLNGMLKSLNFEVIDLGRVADSLSETQHILTKAATVADVVITTGGASVGEEDYIQAAIKSLGQIDFWRIALKPGKPFMFGSISNTPILGLPGNPGAVFVTFSILARPFLLRTQGCTADIKDTFFLELDFDVKRSSARREFLRVKQNAQGKLCKHPNQSSGMLSSASWAEGFAVIVEHRAPQNGELVEFIPFSSLFSLSN